MAAWHDRCNALFRTFPIVQDAIDEHRTQAHPGHAASMGYRGRPGDFRGVLRLELWLGRGRDPGVPGDLAAGRLHVCLLYIQLHRTDHRDSPCRRPFCLQPPGFRRKRRDDRRAGDPDRIRLRPTGHRPGHRCLLERAVSGAGPQARRSGGLCRLHGPEHSRGEAGGNLRTGGLRPGGPGIAGIHGRGGPGVQLQPLRRQWLGRHGSVR